MGSIPAYGYKIEATNIPARTGVKKILVVDEDEAPIVRRVFELAQFGKNGIVMGAKEIAEELNEQGILRRSAKWTIRHVENVLKNSVCVGKLVTFRRSSQTKSPHPQSAWITTKVPPILDKAVFNAVQKQLATRRPPNTENRSGTGTNFETGVVRTAVGKTRKCLPQFPRPKAKKPPM